MIEENLSSKMAEFMTALDQLKKYRAILASMTDFSLIILGTVVAALTVYICVRLSLFIVTNDVFYFILGFLFVAIFPVGIITAVYWVRRRVKSVNVGQWKNTLDEGAPGAIKLIQELRWDNIFSDIRYAKLGFFLYGIAKIFVGWLIAFIASFAFSLLMEFLLHISTDLITIMLFSLVAVLFFSRNDLRKRYEQIGRLDWLLWELRWFESEFRGANFEA